MALMPCHILSYYGLDKLRESEDGELLQSEEDIEEIYDGMGLVPDIDDRLEIITRLFTSSIRV